MNKHLLQRIIKRVLHGLSLLAGMYLLGAIMVLTYIAFTYLSLWASNGGAK